MAFRNSESEAQHQDMSGLKEEVWLPLGYVLKHRPTLTYGHT